MQSSILWCRTEVGRRRYPTHNTVKVGRDASGYRVVSPLWSSGLGRLAFTQEATGSNPVGGTRRARVVKLVDTPASKTGAERHRGSSPLLGIARGERIRGRPHKPPAKEGSIPTPLLCSTDGDSSNQARRRVLVPVIRVRPLDPQLMHRPADPGSRGYGSLMERPVMRSVR